MVDEMNGGSKIESPSVGNGAFLLAQVPTLKTILSPPPYCVFFYSHPLYFCHTMGNLYGKDASDPEWPSGGSTRATKVTYSVTESQQLKVEGSASKGEYELHQDKETIIGIVELMNEITEERQKKAVGEYKEGLLRYLTAIMRRVADFSKRKKPNLIEKTLRDYMDREVNGFTHDPAGRLAWKDWKQSVAEEEAPGKGSRSVCVTWLTSLYYSKCKQPGDVSVAICFASIFADVAI